MFDLRRGALALLGLVACVSCVSAFRPRVPGARSGGSALQRLASQARGYRRPGRTVVLARYDEDEDGFRSALDEMEELRPPRLGLREGEKEAEADAESEVLWEITRSDDGSPRFRMRPQVSAFEDLWPVLVAYVRGILDFDREGTKRRQAQVTIVSVAGLAAACVLIFLVLLPAGFIHRPNPTVTATRPTYRTKTYINPDKVLEDDFVRAGGVYMYDWDNPIDKDDF